MFSGVRRWFNAYLFKRGESIAQRAQIEAGYAVLTWRFDTKDLIQGAVSQYPRSSRHELVVMQNEADGLAIDIGAQKNRIRSLASGDMESNEEIFATLTYSLQINGAVSVGLHSQRSAHATLIQPMFVLAVLPLSQLAGIAGRHRIKEQLTIFNKLCQISMTEASPSMRDRKFLDWLHRKDAQYKAMVPANADYISAS